MRHIKPYENSSLSKKDQIRSMFDRISLRYDFLNHVLSFGLDSIWRRKVVSIVKGFSAKEVLDVATGTGDMAIMVAKGIPGINLYALDLSKGMLELAKKKILSRGLEERIKVIHADSEEIPFRAKHFDVVTVAFGVRNFENLETALLHIHRVLKVEGKIVILEFSKPTSSFIQALYRFYSKYILPNIGKWISGDKHAYKYLHVSAEAFPHGDQMEDILHNCGFSEARTITLTFGIVSIYIATRK